MTELVELLQQLGFSEYEARAYITLLQHSPANGYALAKASGIPRANIYAVLQKLEARGAVLSVEGDGSNTYRPVPPVELMRRLSDRYSNVLESAQEMLEQLAPPPEDQFVQNIQGYPHLLEHAQNVINQASQQLILALWQPEAMLLAPSVAQADEHGVTLTTLCLQACPHECGGCRGNVYCYHVTPNDDPHWLIVIGDQTDMVMGTTGQQTIAMRTRNPQLIELTSAYIRHSIALAAMLADMGPGLEPMLKPATRSLLASIGDGTSWLQTLSQALQKV